MVPRFFTNSSRVMPMPVSAMVNVPADSSVVTVIAGEASPPATSPLVRRKRIFSHASAALETSSRTNTSRSV